MISKQIEILEWDSTFFGHPVAKIANCESGWDKALNSLKSKGLILVYWQVEINNSAFANFATKNNGFLVDKKTTYSTIVLANDLVLPNQIELYQRTEPEEELLGLSVQCGSHSRFNVDPNIANEKFKELYRLWMVQSVKKEMADDVLVYKLDGRIVGVITVYLKNEVGNIGLIGVDKQHRGQGVGKVLITAAKAYFSMKGVRQIDVVTQGLNQQACALYERTGFSIRDQSDFYHFWLK